MSHSLRTPATASLLLLLLVLTLMLAPMQLLMHRRMPDTASLLLLVPMLMLMQLLMPRRMRDPASLLGKKKSGLHRPRGLIFGVLALPMQPGATGVPG